MYELTYEQSLQLLMGESRYVRKGVIEVLKAQQGKIEDQQRKIEELSNYDIPKSFSEALMLAAEQAKEIEEKDSLLETQEPKVKFYHTVTESDDTVDMAECAKILYKSLEGFNLGRNNLFAYLRNKNVLRHNNEPYQLYVDKGYFKSVDGTPYKRNGETYVPTKTVVYQKGIDFIIKLWKGENV